MMRAIVAREGSLSLKNMPEPVPGDGQVLVRTLATGICGSDLHALHNISRRAELAQRAGYPVYMHPDEDVVFGHEFCAEIIGYGPQTARSLSIGTKVISLPFARGPSGFELVGFSNRFPGGFGEQMVLTESLLIPVSDAVSPVQAAIVEPLAVGAHAVKAADLPVDAACMVIGCGPIGLAIIASLKAKGHGPIAAVDYSARRRTVALSMGADSVIDPAEASPHKSWHEMGVGLLRRDPTLADALQPLRKRPVVFECVGVPGVLQSLFDGVPPYTRIVVVGVCQETDRIDQWIAIQKQVELRYVFGCSRDEFYETYENLRTGKIDPTPMLSKVVPLIAIPQAFDALKAPDGEVKVVIDLSSNSFQEN